MIYGDPYKESGMSDLDYYERFNPVPDAEEDLREIEEQERLEWRVEELVEHVAAEIALGKENADAWMAGALDVGLGDNAVEPVEELEKRVSRARPQAIAQLLEEYSDESDNAVREIRVVLLDLKSRLGAPVCKTTKERSLRTEDVISDDVPF